MVSSRHADLHVLRRVAHLQPRVGVHPAALGSGRRLAAECPEHADVAAEQCDHGQRAHGQDGDHGHTHLVLHHLQQKPSQIMN